MLGRPIVDGAEALRSWAVPLAMPLRTFKIGDPGVAPSVKETRLLSHPPTVRRIERPDFAVQTYGWKFGPPVPGQPVEVVSEQSLRDLVPDRQPLPPREPTKRVRVRPTGDNHLLKDRLLYLLQPPLDGIFDGRQLDVPFEPFPYQLEGIAFLMPRRSALLADEMGLGKTAQTILALRLLFHQGLIHKGLLICPKPLVPNWARELAMWAPDVPFETIAGDSAQRRRSWLVSNCPLKLINYETLCRDADVLKDVNYDVVVIDEAQRIKNRGSRTAEVVTSIRRERSWALTGTPIENHADDLANLFAFVDPGRVPPDTPSKLIAGLTGDAILRRTKDVVQKDMPPKMIVDVELELTGAQRAAYNLAEKDGVIHLNDLGDTLTVQHVFQLVMRLKQICNFDPLTGESAKMERLIADMEEVAESGRKAIVFSQWVEPLLVLADALQEYGPLQFHGRVPQSQRMGILDRFKDDPDSHVILMTYGTGSVGLNLQFTNYVFLFDRWWNPAIEDQAINRAHRIGQKHPVTVKRFLSAETIEGRIAKVLEEKRKIFNDILNNAEKPTAMGLSEDEIFGLFDIKRR